MGALFKSRELADAVWYRTNQLHLSVLLLLLLRDTHNTSRKAKKKKKKTRAYLQNLTAMLLLLDTAQSFVLQVFVL